MPPLLRNSLRPVKQKRALLESNPLRDNRIEGDEIKTSPSLGRVEPPQSFIGRPFYFEPSMPQKTHATSELELRVLSCLHVNWKSPFHAEPRHNDTEFPTASNCALSTVPMLNE